jgi:hypothetical protein
VRRSVLVLAVVLLGCPSGQERADAGTAEQTEAPPKPTSPSDEAGVLALLAPMPEGAVQISYDITGPGGLAGELVIVQKAGGWRSERWTMTTADNQLAAEGRTIATPRMLWTATGVQPGERMDLHLGAIADAWLALPPERRDAAAANLAQWRAELEKSRLEQPGEGETIEGIRCVKMRIAAQNLCLWEETGLLLRYEGAAFQLVAMKITTNPSIAKDAFELPPQAKDAKQVAVEPIDATALVEGLADGKIGPIGAVLAPGMRLKRARLNRPPRRSAAKACRARPSSSPARCA